MAAAHRAATLSWRPKPSEIPTQPGVYRFRDKTNSSVAQLNSTFGTAVNELRFTYRAD